jgi:type I restriction enzyme, S subunit
MKKNLVLFPDVIEFLEGPGVRNWQFRNSGVKLINIRNLVDNGLDLTNTNNYLDENEVKEKYNHFLLSKGDFVIASSGVTWGKIAEVKCEHLPLCLNTSIIKILPKDERVAKQYLWHFIKSNEFRNQIDRLITGSAQPNFGPSHLKKVFIPVFPLDTQKKIAEILDTADRLRQKDKALIEKYNQLTQSLFLEMFGDPVRNEKGWDTTKLKNIIEFKRESILPDKIKDGTSYVGLENIEKETGVIIDIQIVKKGFLKSNKFIFDQESILYGKLRPYLNKVALPSFNGICSTDIIPLKAKINKSNKYFICQLMKLPCFVSFATERSSGANLPRISPKDIGDFESISPPIDLQNKFASMVEEIEKQKQLAEESLKQSEALFNSLLQKAFKGELVV